MSNPNKYNHVPKSTITRDLRSFDEQTGNLYESLVVISKRANQISSLIKEELNDKLSEFTTPVDNLEEVQENKEQIELSKQYEQMPKPSLIATQEFIENKIYFRYAEKEQDGEA